MSLGKGANKDWTGTSRDRLRPTYHNVCLTLWQHMVHAPMLL